MEIRLDSGDSILTMNDLKLLYFGQAITLEGAGEALLSHTYVAHSDHGITASVDRIRIIENTIDSSEIGVDVRSGTAFIGNNRIANTSTAGILVSSEGKLRLVDNVVDPAVGCDRLEWGNVEPSQRVCRPWYKGSEFDVPGDAKDQYMFDQYWPRTTVNVASNSVPHNPTDATRP